MSRRLSYYDRDYGITRYRCPPDIARQRARDEELDRQDEKKREDENKNPAGKPAQPRE